MAKRTNKKSVGVSSNKLTAVVVQQLTPGPAPQAVIDRLGGSALRDLEDHYHKFGRGIFDQIFVSRPDIYVKILMDLTKVLKIDLHTTAHPPPKPQSIDEILDRVEQQTGKEGRAAFEKFLEKVKPKT